MIKPLKADVVKLIKDLENIGFGQEYLAYRLGKTSQTIWSWASETRPRRVPCLAEFEMLQKILKGK